MSGPPAKPQNDTFKHLRTIMETRSARHWHGIGTWRLELLSRAFLGCDPGMLESVIGEGNCDRANARSQWV
jgi:hypothetical protein